MSLRRLKRTFFSPKIPVASSDWICSSLKLYYTLRHISIILCQTEFCRTYHLMPRRIVVFYFHFFCASSPPPTCSPTARGRDPALPGVEASPSVWLSDILSRRAFYSLLYFLSVFIIAVLRHRYRLQLKHTPRLRKHANGISTSGISF